MSVLAVDASASLGEAPRMGDVLDLRGLKCPLPVLRARRALAALRPGDMLVLTATDPMAAIDIPNLLRERGDVLAEQTCEDGVLTFRIRRGDGLP